MQGQVSLLAIALLPLAAGVLIAGFGPAWRRWFGDERALMLAGRVALGSTLLAGMLLALALYVLARRPDLAPVQDLLWASAGRTTVLALHLELGMLARVVCAVALTIALAVQVAAFGDPRRGTGDLGRAALLLGGVLLTALGTTVWGVALGWQIAALASGRLGQVLGDRSSGTGPFEQVGWRWSDGGVWLAVLAIAIGAGDLGLDLVTRSVLFGAHSTLLLGAPIAGAAPVTVAVLGLLVAVLGRLCGLRAALRGEAAAGRAALLGLGAGAGLLLLLRLHVVLVLAPTLMAGLVLVAGAGALGFAVAGLRARGDDVLVRVAQAHLGLAVLALGFGAWVPAAGLLLASGLASAAATLAWSTGGRAGSSLRWLCGLALAGLLPGGLALWAGEIGGASFTYMSAWSPWLNWAAAGLVGCTLLAIAGSMGHVLRDRSSATGGPELALAGGLLTAGALVIGAIDVPGVVASLRVWLWPEFAASWLLRDEFGLGPLPQFRAEEARLGALVVVGVAALGFGLAPRLRGWALRLPALAGSPGAWLARRARALLAGLHELGERRVLGLLLGPGSPGVARAPGRGDLQAALVLALLGAVAVLAAVFANPDVVQVGPTRVYPVDVGGLNPALLGSKRGGKGAAGSKLAPGTGDGAGLAPGTGDVAGSKLAPGTGDGAGLAPGTGDGAGSKLAPGTGDVAGSGLAPGTGDVAGSKLAPGTGASR